MLKGNTPYSWMNQLKQKLKTLKNISVISCVEDRADRVNHLVIVENKNGSLWLCLDPLDLNHAIISEFNRALSPKQISNKCKGKYNHRN